MIEGRPGGGGIGVTVCCASAGVHPRQRINTPMVSLTLFAQFIPVLPWQCNDTQAVWYNVTQVSRQSLPVNSAMLGRPRLFRRSRLALRALLNPAFTHSCQSTRAFHHPECKKGVLL